MKKFFNDLKINGVEWSECSSVVKLSAVLNILTFLIMVVILVKIALFSNISDVSTLAIVVIMLLCGDIKIRYKK